jgi:hypothetical protein
MIGKFKILLKISKFASYGRGGITPSAPFDYAFITYIIILKKFHYNKIIIIIIRVNLYNLELFVNFHFPNQIKVKLTET